VRREHPVFAAALDHQAASVIYGSFMPDATFWTALGAIAAVGGTAVAGYVALRPRSNESAEQVERRTATDLAAGQSDEQPSRSMSSTHRAEITFTNRGFIPVQVWWLNFEGQPVRYGELGWGQSLRVSTYLTHPWQMTLNNRFLLGTFMPQELPSTIVVPPQENPETMTPPVQSTDS
jgi:hypothetical protein